ncbi:hypothetical protein ACFFRR_003116 [Megaselia abdita]
MLCTIEFLNNPQKTFYAGNTLYGLLHIFLKQAKFIDVLIIHIKGRAKVGFKDDRSLEFRSAKRKLIDENLLVLSNIQLPPGHHSFHFDFALPWSCPQSLKSKSGFIKYEAVVVIPRTFRDKRIPFKFTILSYFPLPFIEEIDPIKVNISTQNTVSFPKYDFILGEPIFIDIDIDELGLNKKDRKIIFCLVQYIWYHSNERCGSVNKKKEKTNILRIPIVTSESIYNSCFRIPPTIPTTMEYLDIIKIRYALKIYVDKEKFKCPIVIGDYYQ